jgi:hypothetical protein
MSHGCHISGGSSRQPDIACLLERAVDLHADLDVVEASVVDDYVPSGGEALRAQDWPDSVEAGNDVPPEGPARRGPADRRQGGGINTFDADRWCRSAIPQLVRKISE